MGTNCVPLVEDLFLFCYERDFMLLNIDNNFFDSMVNHIYPSGNQLNKANVPHTEAAFLDLHLSIS